MDNSPDNVTIWGSMFDTLRQSIDRLANSVQMKVGDRNGPLGEAVQYRPGAARSYIGGRSITDIKDQSGGHGEVKIYTEGNVSARGGEHAVTTSGNVMSVLNARHANDSGAGMTGFSHGYSMNASDAFKASFNFKALQDAGHTLKVFYDSLTNQLNIQRFDRSRSAFVPVTGRDVRAAGGVGFTAATEGSNYTVSAKNARDAEVGEFLFKVNSDNNNQLTNASQEGKIVYREANAIAKTKAEQQEDLRRFARGESEYVTGEMEDRKFPTGGDGNGGPGSVKEQSELARIRKLTALYGLFSNVVTRFGKETEQLSSAVAGGGRGATQAASMGLGPWGMAAGAIIGAAGPIYDFVMGQIRRDARVTQQFGQANRSVTQEFGSVEKAAISANLGNTTTGALMQIAGAIGDKDGVNTVGKFANMMLKLGSGDSGVAKDLSFATGGAVNRKSSSAQILQTLISSARRIQGELARNPQDAALIRQKQALERVSGLGILDLMQGGSVVSKANEARGKEVKGTYQATIAMNSFDASMEMFRKSKIKRIAEFEGKFNSLDETNIEGANKLVSQYQDVLNGVKLTVKGGKVKKDTMRSTLRDIKQWASAEKEDEVDIQSLIKMGFLLKGDKGKRHLKGQIEAFKNSIGSLSPDAIKRFDSGEMGEKEARQLMSVIGNTLSSSGFTGLGGDEGRAVMQSMFDGPNAGRNLLKARKQVEEQTGQKVSLPSMVTFLLTNQHKFARLRSFEQDIVAASNLASPAKAKASEEASKNRLRDIGNGSFRIHDVADGWEGSVLNYTGGDSDVVRAMESSADVVTDAVSSSMNESVDGAHEAAESAEVAPRPSAPSVNAPSSAESAANASRTGTASAGGMVVSINFNAKVDVSDKETSAEKARAMVESFGGEIEKRIAKIIFDAAPGSGTTLSA